MQAGVARMAYRGVVTFMYENRTRVYLALPSTNKWRRYDPAWG
jgi:hypothetical protein